VPVKGARYDKSKPFRGEGGFSLLFQGKRPRAIGPASAVLEYRIREGDRLDLIALYFYKNDRRWWRILDANPWVDFGADLSLETSVGEVLLIPALIEPGAER